MDELSLDLKIRKTEEGWDAEVFSGLGWSVGARGNTPQRAMLRLALALIASIVAAVACAFPAVFDRRNEDAFLATSACDRPQAILRALHL